MQVRIADEHTWFDDVPWFPQRSGVDLVFHHNRIEGTTAMNTYVGFAYAGEETPGEDVYTDGQILAKRCYKQVEGFGEPSLFPPRLLILLASPKYLEKNRAYELVPSITTFFHARYGERVPLIGSSVAAVLFDRHVHEHGAVLICLASRLLKAKVSAASNLSTNPPEAAFRDLIAGLGINRGDPNPGGNRQLLLFLPSQLSCPPRALYKKLSMQIDYQLSLTGGVSTPPDLQFTEFGVQHGTAVAALIEFHAPVASGLGRSLKTTGKHAIVRKSEGRLQIEPEQGITVEELVDEKGFALLGRMVEDRAISALTITRAQNHLDMREVEDVQDGELLDVLDADRERMYAEAKLSITMPRARTRMDNPIGCITFQCAASYRYREAIGLNIPHQLTAMEEALAGGPVVGGFFYGEIGVDFTRRSMLANWAGAALTFGDEMRERFARQLGFKAIAYRSGQLSNAESVKEVIEESLNMIEDAGYPGSMISLALPNGPQNSLIAKAGRGPRFSKLMEFPGCLQTKEGTLFARAGKPDYLSGEGPNWPRQYIIPLLGRKGKHAGPITAEGREVLGFLHIDLGESGKKTDPPQTEKEVLDALGAAVESSLVRVLIWQEAEITRKLDQAMSKALVANSVAAGRQLLIEAAVRAFGGNTGYIRMRNENVRMDANQPPQLEIVAGSGQFYDTHRKSRAQIDLTDRSLSARAFVLDQSRAINNPQDDEIKTFRNRFSDDPGMMEVLDHISSYAAAVLKDASGEKIGTVIIQAEQPWWFHRYHLRCLEAFGERLRSVVDHLKTTLAANFLLRIGEKLPAAAHAPHLESALKTVVQNFQEASRAEIVSLFLWEESVDRFVLYAQAGWQEHGWELAAYYPRHEGWTGSVALEDDPHYEADLQEYKLRTGIPAHGTYERAMFGPSGGQDNTEAVGLPLKAGGKRLGVLVAFRRYGQDKDDWKKEPLVTTDQAVLAQAADRIAGYLSALLLQRTERLERERAARREAISQALLAAEETGPEEVLCQQLSTQYKAEAVFFYALHNGKLECVAQSTNGKELSRNESIPDNVLEGIASTPHFYFKQNEPRESEPLKAHLTSQGLLNRACIPLSVKGLIGIVDMRWRKDLKRSEHILSYGFKELSDIAAMMASIYQRHLLKSELQAAERKADDLERRSIATADAMIAPAQQALHRCNNLDALLDGLEKLIRLNKDQEKILRRVDEIRAKTSPLPYVMEFLKAGSNPVRAKESLKSLAEAAARQFTWEGDIIYVESVAEELMVNVNRAWIEQAFFNIIDNGIRAIREKGEPGVLTISASVHKSKVRVVFKDTGVGMTGKEVQLALAGSSERKLDRTGIGVPLTRVLLTNQGGDLSITSQKGFGTEIIVDLPLAAKENGL